MRYNVLTPLVPASLEVRAQWCRRSGFFMPGSKPIHGHAKPMSRTYKSWLKMRERCQLPSSNRYEKYGARGITVCERWQKFENFLADMGERPEGKSIDRIDNEQGYTPENCRWATPHEQSLNRRPRTLNSHCRRGHEQTPENLYFWNGRRYCRVCRQVRLAAR